MRVALEVWSSDFEQVESTCRLAERLDFDAFYYGESPNDLNLECWATLAALARSTTKIRLGPVIANVLPTYRSTTLLARQAAAVAAISGGRLDFRTGVGAAATYGRAWWQRHGVDYPDYDRRLTDTRAALETLPGLWVGGPAIPITVAASGERALALAATHGQAWETSFCTPDEFRRREARFGALLGGRRVVRSLEIDGFVAPSQNGLNRLLERVRTRRGAAEDIDHVMERALVGTPTAVSERLLELAAAGVEQVVVALDDPNDAEALRALAEATTVVRHR